jgi:hypothetical protein
MAPQETVVGLISYFAECFGQKIDIKVAKDLLDLDRIIASLWPGQGIVKLMKQQTHEMLFEQAKKPSRIH